MSDGGKNGVILETLNRKRKRKSDCHRSQKRQRGRTVLKFLPVLKLFLYHKTLIDKTKSNYL